MPAGFEYPAAPPNRWRQLLDDPAVTILFAEADDGELVGYAACGESRDPDAGAEVGELRTLFVLPGSWRSGAGRALTAAAFDDLRERGYREATVWSFAGNERANAFYERAGFERDGTERTQEEWAYIAQVRYRRAL